MSLTIATAQALAFARLEAIVRSATPLQITDQPFVVAEDGEGRRVALEDMAAGTRYIEWRHAEWAVRDPSRVTGRVVHRLVMRVRYDLDTIAPVGLERLIAEDLVVLDDALRVPADWQMGTTGIKAIMQDGQIGKTTGPGWVIVGVPYTLTLEACC